MRQQILWVSRVGLAAGLMAVTACGGGGAPTSPTTSPTPSTGGGGTTGSTITITSGGVVSPRTVTITQGMRVTFVNNHTRSHNMSSDDHPLHEDCPEINQVGFLQPGQSRETGNLNTVRTCGFHDHDDPSNTGLTGQITIRAQ